VFTIDGERHSVRAGDSIHFRTHLPHSWANPNENPARAIWLVVRSS
jgi:quercetin dioxygenase-like cupin family protein